MSMSKSDDLSRTQKAVPCNICEDKAPGQYNCIECNQTLCLQCKEYHRRSKSSKDHNVLLRTEIDDTVITTQSCTDHGDQTSFQCEKCNVPGNSNSSTGDHKEHTVFDLTEGLEKLHVSSPSSIIKPPKQTTPTLVSKFKCPLKGYPSICITKEGYVWLGGHESMELVRVDINGQVLSKRSIHNKPDALAVMDCGDLIISPNDSMSVIRLLRDEREQRIFDASPSYSYGVSVTTDQKILICTWEGRVVRTNGDGTYVRQIYKDSGDFSVTHAVENADGNIYISDWTIPAVVMVSKDGNVLSKITRTTGGQLLGSPRSLMVDKMGNILCADIDNDCVYIIDQNQQMRELVGRSHDIYDPGWMAVDGDNNLWITHIDGTVRVMKY